MATTREKVQAAKDLKSESSSSSVWDWVDGLGSRVDNLAVNAEKISGIADKASEVLGTFFGSKDSEVVAAAEVRSLNWVDYLPLLAVGGLIAMIL